MDEITNILKNFEIVKKIWKSKNLEKLKKTCKIWKKLKNLKTLKNFEKFWKILKNLKNLKNLEKLKQFENLEKAQNHFKKIWKERSSQHCTTCTILIFFSYVTNRLLAKSLILCVYLILMLILIWITWIPMLNPFQVLKKSNPYFNSN